MPTPALTRQARQDRPPVLRRAGSMVMGLVLATLGGCAAMSADECRTADWREQGIRDALAGYERTRLQDVRKACAEAGVMPDETQYWQGWQRGIAQFCTPANGLSWGRQGGRYANSCPPELEQGFLPRYQLGYRAWQAEQDVNRLRNEQTSKERDLSKAKDDGERRRLRRDLSDLDWRLRSARDTLDRAEWAVRQSM
ncbi:hypothetical protein OPEN69S_02707 [Ottowia pentelensis]